jgi:hypothetical protein
MAMDSIIPAALLKLLEGFGWPGLIFLIWYLTHRADNAKWDNIRIDDSAKRKEEAEIREKDRVEHMAKWNSMVTQQSTQMNQILLSHRDETDRTYKLLDRQTSAIEMQAHLLTVLNAKFSANGVCPFTTKPQQVTSQKGDIEP